MNNFQFKNLKCPKFSILISITIFLVRVIDLSFLSVVVLVIAIINVVIGFWRFLFFFVAIWVRVGLGGFLRLSLKRFLFVCLICVIQSIVSWFGVSSRFVSICWFIEVGILASILVFVITRLIIFNIFHISWLMFIYSSNFFLNESYHAFILSRVNHHLGRVINSEDHYIFLESSFSVFFTLLFIQGLKTNNSNVMIV